MGGDSSCLVVRIPSVAWLKLIVVVIVIVYHFKGKSNKLELLLGHTRGDVKDSPTQDLMLILFLVRKCWRSFTLSFMRSPLSGGFWLRTPHREHRPPLTGRQAQQKILEQSAQVRFRLMKLKDFPQRSQ